MNAKIRRRIARAKSKLNARLAEAVQVNDGGPVLRGRPRYELADKVHAHAWGGIGAMHRMVQKLGLPARINEMLPLLKVHVPYHESDHVLNIAYNALCGGRTLDDIELRLSAREKRQGSARQNQSTPEGAAVSTSIGGWRKSDRAACVASGSSLTPA